MKCEKLHKLFSEMKRTGFPFDHKKMPQEGIYILFEKGEEGHGADRIVRVGTHTGERQLPFRMMQHFITENKDRSIFRKNIGRAILNQREDPHLSSWEIDMTTIKARERNKNINFERQREIEGEVSKYIQENFTFVTIPIADMKKRLLIESKIISTISKCEGCKPSANWLGNHSTKEKIRKSGLWLVNELWKEEISDSELEELEEIIKSLN
jgi:hypothetical protein